MNKNKSIVVIGGGIAGLVATQILIEKGLKVILIEKKITLGGRAFSFKNSESNENIDNGQHIFTKNCSEYIKFLKNLEVFNQVILEKSINVPIYKNNKKEYLKFSGKPNAISLFLRLLRFNHISYIGKLRIIYALIIIKFKKNLKDLDSTDFKTWLKKHHQTYETNKYFWELFLKPALNDELEYMSSYIAILTIKNSILKPQKTAFGLPKTDLSSLVEKNFNNILRKTNSILIKGKTVKKISEDNNNNITKIELSDNTEIKVDSIICTIPFFEIKNLFQKSSKITPIINNVSQLEYSPIVCIHFWFSEKITDELYFSVLDSPIQWVFNVSKIREHKDQNKQHLVISLSSAWKWIKYDRKEMISIFSKEIYKLLQLNSRVKIKQTLIVNQPKATFRTLPGSYKLRPKNSTPLKNLFLAGDWTDTEWPSTMESAAKSGRKSAEDLLRYLKSL